MHGKTLARLGALVFAAIAITAAVIEIDRPGGLQDDLATLKPTVSKRDPLGNELARCGLLGEAGPRDPSCLKAWAENRRRFLGRTDREGVSVSAAPVTLFPSAPVSADQSGAAPSVPALLGGR